MRYHEIIRESISSQRWTEFLDLLQLWTTFVSDEYEDGGKRDIETGLLQYEDITQHFRTVPHQVLMRGTGLPHGLEAKLRAGQTVTLDTSESVLTSWTSQDGTARHFAEKFGGAILTYSVHDLPIFLSIPAIWQAMSLRERSTYDGIEYGNREREVLVRLPNALVVTPTNILEFVERVDDDEDYAPEDEQDNDNEWETVRAIPVAQARQELIRLAIRHHPDKDAGEIAERVNALSGKDLYDMLLGYRRR